MLIISKHFQYHTFPNPNLAFIYIQPYPSAHGRLFASMEASMNGRRREVIFTNFPFGLRPTSHSDWGSSPNPLVQICKELQREGGKSVKIASCHLFPFIEDSNGPNSLCMSRGTQWKQPNTLTALKYLLATAVCSLAIQVKSMIYQGQLRK